MISITLCIPMCAHANVLKYRTILHTYWCIRYTQSLDTGSNKILPVKCLSLQEKSNNKSERNLHQNNWQKSYFWRAHKMIYMSPKFKFVWPLSYAFWIFLLWYAFSKCCLVSVKYCISVSNPWMCVSFSTSLHSP